MPSWRLAVAVALLLATPSLGAGQPAGEDASSPGVRLSLGGEVTGTFSAVDDGFFNFTDYEHSVTRLAVGTVSGALRFTHRLELLGELRVQNGDAAASGLYLRFRPRPATRLAVQVGRIPPVFGRFSRRGYGGANPLIGIPLAYQYLTTLRSTAVPLGTDALLDVRGRGWLVGYPVSLNADGSRVRQPAAGMPLVTSTRWDTGAQAHYERTGLGASLAVTSGSLSNPRVDDDNDGRQVAGRLIWRPRPPLEIGGSFSRGAFLARGITDRLPPDTPRHDYLQTAWALDAELSAGHWVIGGEAIVSRWRLPAVGAVPLGDPLRSTGLTLEARYRLTPRLHVAARGERLLFSRVRGSVQQGRALPWDAPVSRVETGVGYALHRQVQAKVTWQYNWRDGVSRPQPREGFLATQVSAWF